jgi:hypothetical protein
MNPVVLHIEFGAKAVYKFELGDKILPIFCSVTSY